MAHHIYHTTAFVCAEKPLGEHNRAYKLFTRELGMVVATAQSARKLHSKARLAIVLYKFARVDMVRGKVMWRIGSTQSFDVSNIDMRVQSARIASILLRLIPEEESNEELFDDILLLYPYLSENVFELALVARILFHLGYWNREPTDVLIVGTIDELRLYGQSMQRTDIVRNINTLLEETQL
ncbi:MAG: DNA repair protein RecO [Minisyncoccia bacterium]